MIFHNFKIYTKTQKVLPQFSRSLENTKIKIKRDDERNSLPKTKISLSLPFLLSLPPYFITLGNSSIPKLCTKTMTKAKIYNNTTLSWEMAEENNKFCAVPNPKCPLFLLQFLPPLHMYIFLHTYTILF